MQNPGMIDPISPMGRAGQAMTDGKTPEQVQAVAQQAQQSGLATFDQIMSLKQRLDLLKQSGAAQPPPQTTVLQDMQSQMPGIAGLPANVGNKAAYARGGIVAFSGGGTFNPMAGVEGMAERAGMTAPYGAANATGAAGSAGLNGIGQAELAAAKAEIAAAEKAAASAVGTAAKRGIASRALASVSRFVPNVYVSALLIGAPLLYSLLKGDDEEAPQQQPPVAPPPAQDLSGLVDEYKNAESSKSGIAGLGVSAGPNVSGAFDPLREKMDSMVPELKDRSEYIKDAEGRYAGLDEYLKQRGAALDKQGADLDADKKDDFWSALASGAFEMAKQSGPTAYGAAPPSLGSAFAGGAEKFMTERERLSEAYRINKEKLDESRFALGQAESGHRKGIIDTGSADYDVARNRYDLYKNKQLELEARIVEAELDNVNRQLDRETQMAIATYKEKNLTGLKLLENVATHLGMKYGPDDPRTQQVVGLMNKIITSISPPVLVEGMRGAGMGAPSGFTVLGAE